MMYDKNNERINLVLILMFCLNFAIILYVTGVIGLTLQRIIDTNLANEFLKSLNVMPLTPPFKSLYFAIFAYLLFILVYIFISHKEHSKIVLTIGFMIELILCVFIMYSMGFSSNAIVLLFIAIVVSITKYSEIRTLFVIIGILTFMIFNNNVFTQMEIVSLSDYLSVYTSNMRIILQGIDSVMITFNFVLFFVFMYLLIQKEVQNSKQIRAMYDEVSLLNKQLEEYAVLQEKMGETKERNRLAREIHDTLGHTLTGLSVGIDAAVMLLNVNNEAVLKQLNLLSQTARRGLDDVRRSVEKLRPDALERYSLEEAIRNMILDFEKISTIKITLAWHLTDRDLGADIDEFVYRAIQESITNAVRYGKPNNIYVSIVKMNNTLVLIIEDDGMGCENIKFGFGLYHMKERVNHLHGDIRIISEDGFSVIINIPLRQSEVIEND